MGERLDITGEARKTSRDSTTSVRASTRGRVRRSQAERRDEIARVTYQLLGKYGFQQTTVARIADAVGMMVPSLYAHFGSRYEMLVAAMGPLLERVTQWLRISSNPNVRERLREVTAAHSSFMTAELGFVIPVFEFVLAPRDTDLATRFGQEQLKVLQQIAATVEEGQQQGSIRADIPPMQVAWEIIIMAWSEDIAHLMGLDFFIADDYSKTILDLFFRDMSPPGIERGSDPND